MMQTEKDRLLSLPKMLDPLISKADYYLINAENAYSSFDPSRDMRITCFAKVINNLIPTQLALMVLSEQFFDRKWWWKKARHRYRTANTAMIFEEYESFVKVAFFTGIFSSVESSLRNISREVDPHTQRSPHSSFKSIYDRLLKLIVSVDYANAQNTLEFSGLIRNTLHNNGVYVHGNNTERSIIWKEKDYIFRHKISIDFATWELLIDLTNSMLDLTNKVILDPLVSSIDREMTDDAVNRMRRGDEL